MPTTALLDVDGTLVDTNYHHAVAWYRAFRQHGLTLPLWRIHRHIGMGGDQLVGAVAGELAERRHGDAALVGDSTWDCEAARRAGVPTVAILTGGFCEQELRDAGAVAVFASLGELCEQLDRT